MQEVSNTAIQLANEIRKWREDVTVCIAHRVCPWDATMLVLHSIEIHSMVYRCPVCESEFVYRKGEVVWDVMKTI